MNAREPARAGREERSSTRLDEGLPRLIRWYRLGTDLRTEANMTTTYTWDVFATLDGFGSYGPDGDWGGYWNKQGPDLLERRLQLYEDDQRIVLGAKTFRQFTETLGLSTDSSGVDAWNLRMRSMPATVVSSTLRGPFDWPDATVCSGDGANIVAGLKADSDVPLRSHGSLMLNRALMTAGLVDFLQLTVFPVISGKTGTAPIFAGAADFDLELLDSRTLDDRTQELLYRPTLH
jgi:dihydrofolate reductase